MKMDNDVTQLSRTLNFQIRNLHRIRRFLDFNSCLNAVRPLVLSRLDYCGVLLNGISHKGITRLQRIQNTCARLIFKKPKPTYSSPLLKELHWLPVAQRIQFHTVVHTFKALNNLSPHYIFSLLPVRKPSTYCLRSSTVTCLVVPKTHYLTGDRAFSSSALRLWNKLPRGGRT